MTIDRMPPEPSPSSWPRTGNVFTMPEKPDLGIGSKSDKPEGGGIRMPEKPDFGDYRTPEKPDFSGAGSDPSVVSPEDATVSQNRKPSMLKPPESEDGTHKDIEVPLKDKETLLMRWHEDLGYVPVGAKDKDGKTQMYSQKEFEKVNAGQLKESGGGEIPDAPEKKPDFYVPPEGEHSMIYRHNKETGKDAIVGVRSKGELHYFQSQATMDAVNEKAKAAGVSAPERPPTAPGDGIPLDSRFNGKGEYNQYINRSAPGDDGKNYKWRYDETADRYCAVAEEAKGMPNGFHWFDENEYMARNSGPDAPVMKGNGVKAPVRDPAQPELVEPGDTRIKLMKDNKAGEDGSGIETWGQPVYTRDKHTGHKVYIGVQREVDGDKKTYYFDEQHMGMFNDTVKMGDKDYFRAKDPKTFPEGSHMTVTEPEPNPIKLSDWNPGKV